MVKFSFILWSFVGGKGGVKMVDLDLGQDKVVEDTNGNNPKLTPG